MEMMCFDLHVHAMLSRAIPFKMMDLKAMVAQARSRGLNGFALTEHINAPGYWSTYKLMQETYQYSDGFYKIEPDFFIINGAEISLMHGGDLIALGAPEAIKKMDRKLDLNKGYRPPLPDVLKAADDDLVLIGAHPFRPTGGLLKFDSSYLKRLTALEINGKDYGIEVDVRKFATDLGLPVVGGSDAHYWPQIGISLTMLPIQRPDVATIKKEIAAGSAQVRRAYNAAVIVEMCEAHKKRIKEELGLPRSANKVRQLSLNLL